MFPWDVPVGAGVSGLTGYRDPTQGLVVGGVQQPPQVMAPTYNDPRELGIGMPTYDPRQGGALQPPEPPPPPAPPPPVALPPIQPPAPMPAQPPAPMPIQPPAPIAQPPIQPPAPRMPPPAFGSKAFPELTS